MCANRMFLGSIWEADLGKSSLETSFEPRAQAIPLSLVSHHGLSSYRDEFLPSQGSFTRLSLLVQKFSLRGNAMRLGFKYPKKKKKWSCVAGWFSQPQASGFPTNPLSHVFRGSPFSSLYFDAFLTNIDASFKGERRKKAWYSPKYPIS